MWEMDYKESWAPKNWCFWTVVLEKTLQSPLDYKKFPSVHSKGDQSWMFIGRTDVEAELQYFGHLMWKLTHSKRPWCWERLRAGGEGDNRGWDGWMASSTQWTWVCVNSRSLWWTGRPGMLRFVGSQRVGHNWMTELNWTWGKRWSGNSTCSFKKLKQILPLIYPIPSPRRAPPEPNAQFSSEMHQETCHCSTRDS